jgi:hypothetical protein
MAKDLHRFVETAGILDARAVDHQPACISNEHRHLLKWSVEEAGPAFVGASLITEEQLANTLLAMQQVVDTPDVAIFAPGCTLSPASKLRATVPVS